MIFFLGGGGGGVGEALTWTNWGQDSSVGRTSN